MWLSNIETEGYLSLRKTFKYKAKINNQTEARAIRWLGLCRSLYNACLEQRIDAYKRCGRTVSKYDQHKELPRLKQEFPEYRQVGSQVLQESIDRLDKAIQAFFRRLKSGDKPGFPRFKSKRRYNSFTLKQTGWKLDGKYLHVKHVGTFKLHLSRPIEGKIKTITVRHTSTGKWFVCFSCDEVPPKPYPETTDQIGIDVGISSFLVDSTGKRVANPRHLKRSEKLLRQRQRALSRKRKGSGRRNKARRLVAKTHEKIANQRKDFFHKIALEYVKQFSLICVERLNITNMMQNRHLSKAISDSAWGKFLEILCYKAEEAGREVPRIDPKNTSQKCSRCGTVVKKSLAVRTHNCNSCGLILDRDHNAAINILMAGQAVQVPT